MKFLWEQDVVKSSHEFESGCILTHWQIHGWREDLRLLLDKPGSATTARGWRLTSDVLAVLYM